MISDPQECFRFLVTPGTEVSNLLLASDEIVWVTWKNREKKYMPDLRHSKEVKGTYVTTGACLKINSYLGLTKGEGHLLRNPFRRIHTEIRSTSSLNIWRQVGRHDQRACPGGVHRGVCVGRP